MCEGGAGSGGNDNDDEKHVPVKPVIPDVETLTNDNILGKKEPTGPYARQLPTEAAGSTLEWGPDMGASLMNNAVTGAGTEQEWGPNMGGGPYPQPVKRTVYPREDPRSVIYEKRNIVKKGLDHYDNMNPVLKFGIDVLSGGQLKTANKVLKVGNVLNKAHDRWKLGLPPSGMGGNKFPIQGSGSDKTYSGAPSAHSDINLTSDLGTSINTGTDQLKGGAGGWGQSLLDSNTLGTSSRGGNLGTNNMVGSGTIGQNIISGTKRGLIDPISGLEIKNRNLDEFGKGFN